MFWRTTAASDRIADLESRSTVIVKDGLWHSLVKAAEKSRNQAKPEEKGVYPKNLVAFDF